MGKLLKWPHEKQKFDDYLVEIQAKRMTISANRCINTIDSGSIPIVKLDGVDITSKILGVVSCSINISSFEEPTLDYAHMITTRGVVVMRGIEPDGIMGAELPLWHIQRAADINMPVADDDTAYAGEICMKAMVKLCDFVYDKDERMYLYNGGIMDHG